MAKTDQRAVEELARCASRRLSAARVLQASGLVVATVVASAAVVLVALRLRGMEVSPLLVLVMALPVMAIPLMVRWSSVEVSPVAAAAVLDERLDLEESMSTAITDWPDLDDPFVRAHRVRARGLATEVSPQRAIPLRAPRNWWMVAVAGVLFACAAIVPPGGWDSSSDAASADRAQVDAAASIEQVQAQAAMSPDLMEAMSDPPTFSIQQDTGDADALRREAIRQLSTFEQQLDAFEHSDAQRRLDALRERTASLPGRPPDAASEIRRALRDGDFDEVADALARLESSDGAGAATQATALESLGEDLETLSHEAASNAELAKDAGIELDDDATAEEIEKSIDQATHLSDDARQGLKQQMRDAEQASEALRQLAEEAREAAEYARQSGGQNAQRKEAAESMSKVLQADDRARKQAEACRGACRSASRQAGRGLGQGRSGEQFQQSASRGKGGAAGRTAVDVGVAFSDAGAAAKEREEAPVVRSEPTRGPIRLGNTDSALSPMAAAQQRAAMGFSTARVPPRHRALVAAWFADQLKGAPNEDDDQEPTSP